MLKDFFNQRHGHRRRSLKVRMRIVLERDCETGNSKECTFYGCGYGSRIEDVDPGIKSAVDTADDQVDRFGSKLRNTQFDAVGW